MEETDSLLEELDLCIDEAYQHGAPAWHSPGQGGPQPSRPDHNFFLHNLQHGARIDFYRGVAADDLQNTIWKRWFSKEIRAILRHGCTEDIIQCLEDIAES